MLTLAELVATTGVDASGLIAGLSETDAALMRSSDEWKRIMEATGGYAIEGEKAGQVTEDLGTKSRKASKGVGILERAVGDLQRMVIGYASIHGVKAIYATGRLGAQAIDTERSFERMMSTAGQTGDALGTLRQQARGTTSDLDLMQAANMALVGTTGELRGEFAAALPRLMEWAYVASVMNPRLGDAAFLFDSLTRGIKRNSTFIIDNTGLQLKLGIATERYAEAMGKSTDELDENERTVALLRDTLRAINIGMEQAGDAAVSAAADYQSLTAEMKNLRVEAGKMVNWLTGPLSKGLGDMVRHLAQEVKTTRTATEAMVGLSTGLVKLVASGDMSIGTMIRLEARAARLEAQVRNDTISLEQFEQGMEALRVEAGLTTASFEDIGRAAGEMPSYYEAAWEATATLGLKMTEADVTMESFRSDLEKMKDALDPEEYEQLSRAADFLEQQYADNKITVSEYIGALGFLREELGIVDEEGWLAAQSALKFGEAVEEAEEKTTRLATRADQARAALAALNTDAMRAKLTVDELGGSLSIAAIQAAHLAAEAEALGDSLRSSFEGVLVGYVGEVGIGAIREARTEMNRWIAENQQRLKLMPEFERELMVATKRQEIQDKLDAIIEYRREEERLGEQAVRDAAQRSRQMVEQVRADVRSLMTPTMTFNAEQYFDQIGFHVDTWDEWFRRALDVVNLGAGSPWFQELVSKFPSFQAILAEKGDPKLAAAEWARQFQLGLIPEAVDKEAIKTRYIELITGRAKMEDLINEIAAELGAKGIEVDMPVLQQVTGLAPDTEAALGVGAGLAEGIGTGFTTGFQGLQMAQSLTSHLKEQFSGQHEALEGIGEAAGGKVGGGFLKALTKTDFLAEVADRLYPGLAARLEREGWRHE